MMQLEFGDLLDWQRDIVRAYSNADKRNADVALQYGQILQFSVRMYASGRPGPEVVTGDYRNSVSLERIVAGPTASSEVYTERPQGYRLEFGFQGVDSLGRMRSSPPLPHFMPALYAVAPVWESALAQVMHRALWKGTA